MFLVPVCDSLRYYLCVINLDVNEGYVIDEFNMDSGYKGKRKEYI